MFFFSSDGSRSYSSQEKISSREVPQRSAYCAWGSTFSLQGCRCFLIICAVLRSLLIVNICKAFVHLNLLLPLQDTKKLCLLSSVLVVLPLDMAKHRDFQAWNYRVLATFL